MAAVIYSYSLMQKPVMGSIRNELHYCSHASKYTYMVNMSNEISIEIIFITLLKHILHSFDID